MYMEYVFSYEDKNNSIPLVGPHLQSTKSGHGCTCAVFGNEAFQQVQLSNITGQYKPENI